MKVLILLSYFERPILVLNALTSVLESHKHHQDWELVFGDDGSLKKGKPIAEKILVDHLDRVRFVDSEMSLEDKLEKGILLGKYANEEILRSDADLVVTLSDDDELVPTFLRDVSEFFDKHSDVMYAYSKVHLYNPLTQESCSVNNATGKYNSWIGPINPVNKIDASQVVFRADCFRKHDVRYPITTNDLAEKPWVKNLDGALFDQLYQKFGDCVPTNLIGQFKGIHDYQLVWHKKKGVSGLIEYIKMVQGLAGETI